MVKEKIIRVARFNDKVKTYWLMSGIVVLTFTIVGIPLLLIWIPLGLLVTGRFLNSMECVLTERSLKFKKGLINRTERTVPLDKITDVGLVQGPIMRWLDLEAISVETAGQSTVGATIQITGIEGTREFRDAILEQKDVMTGQAGPEPPPQPQATTRQAEETDLKPVLVEIAGTLRRIEKLMADKNR